MVLLTIHTLAVTRYMRCRGTLQRLEEKKKKKKKKGGEKVGKEKNTFNKTENPPSPQLVARR